MTPQLGAGHLLVNLHVFLQADTSSMDIIACIARELGATDEQVQKAVALLDEGATVPFIARYRKEVTGGLDDGQLRTLETRLNYLRELEQRRTVVLDSIRSQQKLTPELEQAILQADSKALLEDLYLPYKPKRRTKAQIAREAGLEPLADSLLADPDQLPEHRAVPFLNPEHGFGEVAAVLEGARQILMERFAEDAALLQELREAIWRGGLLSATVVAGKEESGAKFKDYFAYEEKIRSIPSHRALALLRGRNEDVLNLSLRVGSNESEVHDYCQSRIAAAFGITDQGRSADPWLHETVSHAWKIKLLTRIDLDLKQRVREAAEQEAIRVFAQNLKDLLLSAPAGRRVTMGLDPGLRTGVKVAVVDATGKLLATATVYPHVPHKQWDRSLAELAAMCRRHAVQLISIGNGTGSRETDRLVAELIKSHPDLSLVKMVVSEAGASVYSASELAAQEFPDLDVSLRGAVSIARRIQDPLAELVKIEPKAIGVGQYQHDVNQGELARSLDAVVEDCVNAVGVDLNTASVPLLRYVSGLSRSIGENIVEFRNQHGAFRKREELLKVPRLGAKTFEQAAGFLRIVGGENPLDASAVHPEAYPVVEKIIAKTGRDIRELLGNCALLRGVNADQFVDDRFGLPTVSDILSELEKPGRDPRPDFKSASFKEGVAQINDLKPGMILEGQVTNVANFGAFVDIGVHQDGLVHISHLSDRFVKDPREIVKAGDVVRVTVLELDIPRRRIALSMRTDAVPRRDAERSSAPGKAGGKSPQRGPRSQSRETAPVSSAMADALSRAFGNKR